MFPVSPAKETALLERMRSLGILEADLEERFVLGSGSGGQKINKTSSCVVLTHRPTGISVRCQRERSQALNRFLARRELCERLEQRTTQGVLAARAEVSKIRRQKAKRSRRSKQKMLEGKTRRSRQKALRRTPSSE